MRIARHGMLERVTESLRASLKCERHFRFRRLEVITHGLR
jgi:hypothetical protein